MSLIPNVGRERFRVRALLTIITTILCLGIALHLFPVWWMFTTSIKPGYEVFKFPPSLWPEEPTLVCYKLFIYLSYGGWRDIQHPVYVYLKNSCMITFITMAIQIPVTSFFAYAISKLYSPKWNRLLFLYGIGTLMIPAALTLIPMFLLIHHFPFPTRHIPNIPFTSQGFPYIDFFDTYWAAILPACFNAFNFLLFKGFFDGIPDEVINAARLDGASEISIFRRIVLPLSKPVFAVTAYFTFSAAWNNFLWPFMVIQTNKLMPLSVIIYKFQHVLTSLEQNLYAMTDEHSKRLVASGMGYNGLMALSIIESIPIFIMFLVFREQLMKGIKLRGFK